MSHIVVYDRPNTIFSVGRSGIPRNSTILSSRFLREILFVNFRKIFQIYLRKTRTHLQFYITTLLEIGVV